MQAPFTRANATPHSVLRWTDFRLGSRASADHMQNLLNAFDRHRSFAIARPSRNARRIFPRGVPLRKRTTARVDQSDSSCCGVERFGGDDEWLPVLFGGLCPKRESLHAILHGSHQSLSENDCLSVSVARCPCSMGSGIRGSTNNSMVSRMTIT